MTTSDVRSIERRRSARVAAIIPVTVRGKTRAGAEFEVKTKTHTISLFGCLVLLDVDVFGGRPVVLSREDTDEAIEGRVVSTWRHPDGRNYMGVAFAQSSQNFWRTAIPAA